MHDGATVLLHYIGLVKPNAKFIKAAQEGGTTGSEDQYLRQVMHVYTGDAR
jgi:hypothetical protein